MVVLMSACRIITFRTAGITFLDQIVPKARRREWQPAYTGTSTCFRSVFSSPALFFVTSETHARRIHYLVPSHLPNRPQGTQKGTSSVPVTVMASARSLNFFTPPNSLMTPRTSNTRW